MKAKKYTGQDDCKAQLADQIRASIITTRNKAILRAREKATKEAKSEAAMAMAEATAAKKKRDLDIAEEESIMKRLMVEYVRLRNRAIDRERLQSKKAPEKYCKPCNERPHFRLVSLS